ncbi:MAG TPA: SCO family protein [Gallionella sp.]|nr:SCO family protein [Gallionella sp.]
MRWWWLWLGLLLGCSPDAARNGEHFVGSVVDGGHVGSTAVLAGHDGKPHRLADFRGKAVLLFFGYTHCPDVCPTAMAELNRAMLLLGARAKEVQVLFVTLDPERDTAAVLSRYVPYFNPAFIGLRGDAEVTKQLARDFKAFYARQASDSRSGYTIDHEAGVYVFDRQGDLRLYMSHGLGGKEIAHDLALLLDEK